jgi:purine-nucleoside phosphorylase
MLIELVAMRKAADALRGMAGHAVAAALSVKRLTGNGEILTELAGVLGADAVGMSVAPEAILARRLGLRLGAVTLITNYGAGYQGGAPTHDQTKSIAAIGAQSLATLLDSFLEGLDTP